MIQSFDKIDTVRGELKLRGDKSISHRAVMFAAMADGVSLIRNCSDSDDVTSTMQCFEKLGCKFEISPDLIKVLGKGYKGFSKPDGVLYAGNSGTTARLISGVLAAQDFESVITGDESLSNRPMQRIVEPLRIMGADISANEAGMMPIIIKPSASIKPVNYELQVASAQVKSALILCALHLAGKSVLIEKTPTRNHTEKLLNLKTALNEEGTTIFASKDDYPEPLDFDVPSDISSASFFIILALLTKNSQIVIKSVSLNETRTGLIGILLQMGGNIELENISYQKGEKVGDIRVASSSMENVEIPASIIPNIIDEIPILAVAGIFAGGKFKISGAKELRVKESDRINALCSNFIRAGLKVTEYEDGFELSGNLTAERVVFESYKDHRIAMAFGVLSLLMESGSSVNDFECVAVSNPKFLLQVNNMSGGF